MQKIEFHAIGKIKSPWSNLEDMPIQSVGAKDAKGTVILEPKFADGLKDLCGFSHIYLLVQFHKSRNFKLHVKPFLSNDEKGVFATRAPKRPNAIGLSIVEILEINTNRIKIRGVDMLDNTPLLDIKPYIPKFDSFQNAESGWLKNVADRAENFKSDSRFR